MKISERHYSHHRKIPNVKVHIDESAELIFVIINWGDQAQADNLIAEMTQFIHAASADVEVTHPYEVVPYLPKDVNTLRIAMLIGNDYFYRQENSHEYIAGVEILIMKKQNNMMSWSCIGRPTLFRFNQNNIEPIFVSGSPLSEIPVELLGIHAKIDVQCGHFLIEPNTELYAYCGVDWPLLDSVDATNMDIEYIFNALLKVQPNISGFWLARVTNK